MKNIRPSLWAVAILALGITVFLFLVLNNREVNIQPLVQASPEPESVSVVVSEPQIIPGQPEVPEVVGVTSGVSETEVALNRLGLTLSNSASISVK